MGSFQFATTPLILFGQPVAEGVRDYCQKQRISRLVVITDRHLVALGLLSELQEALSNTQVATSIFDQVEPDPCVDIVLSAADFAKNAQAQLIIGFGGGSSMDVAKVISVLAEPQCEQVLTNLYGVDQISANRLPLVLVPTTAGTGSEVTPISIITTGGTTKAGIVSTILLPDLAILDPALTLGLPAHITAATGIDAMVHAIEAFTSRIKKNPISDGLACNALGLLANNIKTAVKNGSDIDARGGMLLGSMLAGQAFANAPVGGVHALAYPLGGHFHIPHGLSNALMLPHVMAFNLQQAAAQYAQLAEIVCDDLQPGLNDQDKAFCLIESVSSLIVELGLPNRLRDCGVSEDALPMLAKDAMLQQRLLVNNPVDINYDEALSLYQKAF